MNRRNFLAALGTAAAGTATAVGTGAFTSVSANRSVTVQTAGDKSALLGIVPGDSGLVQQQDDTVSIAIDGSRSGGEGVNLDAVTTIGDPGNPEDDHAFKIVNQGTQSVMLKMNYYFAETDWLGNGDVGKSFLKFNIFDTGDAPTGSASEEYPIQNGYNRDYPLPHPTGSGFGSNTGDYRFNIGEEYYVTLTIDTTGPKASMDDKLSGTAQLVAAEETDGGGYDRQDPPI